MTLKSGIYNWKILFRRLEKVTFQRLRMQGWYRVFAVGSPAQRGEPLNRVKRGLYRLIEKEFLRGLTP